MLRRNTRSRMWASNTASWCLCWRSAGSAGGGGRAQGRPSGPPQTSPDGSRDSLRGRGSLNLGKPEEPQARSVPIPGFLADLLAEVVAGKAPDDLVFTTWRGRPLRNLNFRRDVLSSRGGCRPTRPHTARATAYGRQFGRLSRSQRQGRSADARPCLSGHDARCVLGSLR
jgi:hypothetical protein